VRAAGAGEGVAFAFDRIKRTPSTLQSHRLMRFAGEQSRQDETLEAIFRAYFVEGRNIGDRAVLADIAEDAGLDRTEAADYLAGDVDAEAVLGEDALARRAGINGVPCFIFNGRFALSGAQEPEAFFQLFDLAREEEQARSEAAAS